MLIQRWVKEEVSYDEREAKQYDLCRQCKQTEKGMEYRRNTLEENSHLLWKASAIYALLYSF